MTALRDIGFVTIDDHDVVHAGLELLARRTPGIRCVAAVADPAQAVATVYRLKPDIVLLDLFIGEVPGWAVCREIVSTTPGTRVVFYTAYGNAELVDRALQLGAVGYVLKATRLEQLPIILRTLMQHGTYIDPALIAEWTGHGRGGDSVAVFTEEELSVIRLVAEGLDNHAIAEQLTMSFHTVKFRIGQLLSRTGEANRAGLVRLAKERHLLD